MWIQVTNSECTLIRNTIEEQDWLNSILRVEDKAEMEARKYRTGQRTGGKLVIDLGKIDWHGRLTFPVGVLPIVQRVANKYSKEISIVDKRVHPEISAEVLEARIRAEAIKAPYTCRDYQVDALVSMIYGTSQASNIEFPCRGRGIIKHPTGAGKSNIAAVAPILFGGHWVFLVHRSHLAQDVAERYEKFCGRKAGWIAEGEFNPEDEFTVCTIQTLNMMLGTARFKKWAEGINGVLIDECHTVAAETHSNVTMGFSNAYWKIGLSGTPLDRTDKKSILAVAAIGPIIHEKKAGDLVNEGYLSRPTIKIVPISQPHETFKDWHDLYDRRIKFSDHRNSALVAAMVAHDAPGIVFVRHLDHGKVLVKMAQKKGLNVDFVHGAWSLERRRAVIRKLDRGEVDWVIASAVFNEGVNIPELRTIVLGCGGKSIIQTLQQVGRGTRKTADKDEFTVIDIGDKGNTTLNQHSHARIKSCQREGYKVIVDTSIWPEHLHVKTQ